MRRRDSDSDRARRLMSDYDYLSEEDCDAFYPEDFVESDCEEDWEEDWMTKSVSEMTRKQKRKYVDTMREIGNVKQCKMISYYYGEKERYNKFSSYEDMQEVWCPSKSVDITLTKKAVRDKIPMDMPIRVKYAPWENVCSISWSEEDGWTWFLKHDEYEVWRKWALLKFFVKQVMPAFRDAHTRAVERLSFAPGGAGYEEAKANWESLAGKM